MIVAPSWIGAIIIARMPKGWNSGMGPRNLCWLWRWTVLMVRSTSVWQTDVDLTISTVHLQSQHKFLGPIPLFHPFGILAMMIAPIQLGATIIYLGRFSPVGALNAIREHKASLMFGTPSMYGAMLRLKDAGPDDFKHTYALLSGAEPLPPTI